jgi:hypothetical protein
MGYTNAFAQTVPPLPVSNQSDDSIAAKISKVIDDILNRAAFSAKDQQGDNNTAVVESKDDKTRPVIEILTDKLYEGKNVIYVKITDHSRIDTAFTKFVSNGKIAYGPLVKSENNEYKSLVDAKGPATVIIFNAIDEHGNKAIEKKKFSVEPSKSWFEKTAKWLQDVMPFI